MNAEITPQFIFWLQHDLNYLAAADVDTTEPRKSLRAGEYVEARVLADGLIFDLFMEHGVDLQS